jgi:hypothetical protein
MSSKVKFLIEIRNPGKVCVCEREREAEGYGCRLVLGNLCQHGIICRAAVNWENTFAV